ncbi:type II toxin-antitoxin system RelE/ParE family toxin [Xanthobacter oligotrophicus]|uniref:type II toxin-antitoxin system RelE/ParE family toxin n=1 Tax=Xanthobacter oligotrophicus TaxID=2607286 RepID=UPI00165DB4E1|nr:type II toxin-antitoxin system RelE/ParE family toxin [Xanthobacter oligotrophicus]MCG5234292.1 type II toxin-antitoxin system RelE/ParE family toxin [Xanthobacter oligotrophicus]
MSFRLRATARRNIETIDAYLRAESPAAAVRTVSRLLSTFERLSLFPFSGEPSSRPGVRVTAVPGTRYIVTYRVLPTRDVEVIAVIHSAQNRKT